MPFSDAIKQEELDININYNRFTKPFIVNEVCPDCGHQVEILSHGKSNCTECNHKEMLPCADCPRAENFTCDWNEKTRCSEFPLGVAL